MIKLYQTLQQTFQKVNRCKQFSIIMLVAILLQMVSFKASAQTPGCADLSFDGSSGYVSVATNPAYTSTFTIEAWIKSTSSGGEKNIVSWGSQSANNHNVQFRMDGTKLSFGIWDGSTWNQLSSNTSINTGNWVHVAVVRVGSAVTLYVNGVADNTGTVNGSAVVDKFQIGRFIQQGTPNANSYFPGNIQDVRVWTTARSATEISAYKAVLLAGTETGLLINYKMREGTGTTLTNSVTGNAYPATLNNGATWSVPVALEFNGNNNYISFANSPAYSGTFTLEAWIKSTSSATEREIASWGNTGANNHNAQFRMESGKLQFGIWDGVNWNSTTSSASINSGNWTHVAVVKSGTAVTLYINGVADGTGTNSSTPTVNQFEIGNWMLQGSQNGAYFPGNIRDVRVWSVARTATDINTNKAATLAGTETGLVRYFKINEGTGTAIANSVSGGANPGVVNGTLNWNPAAPVLSQSTGTQTLCNNLPFTPLSVTVSALTALSYQWYSNTTASNTGGSLINGATLSSYTPSSSVVGTTYYYCIASSGTCYTATSAVSGAITVSQCTVAITSISPASGPVGTLLTINGTYLSNLTTFTIGGVSPLVLSNTGTKIVAIVMPGATSGGISVVSLVGTATAAFTLDATPYPSKQQGNKLVGSSYIGQSFQGYSTALSADGNTAIVGGILDDGSIGGAGAVWIYTRTGSAWSQQGNKLLGTGSIGPAYQGSSVALSADGNTAIVGGMSDNSNQGAVWTYTRSGSTWTQQGNKLVGTGNTGAAFQGASVSLSADGNTAIVGGYGDNDSYGAVWIYTRSGNTWTQQGNKLVGLSVTQFAYFGKSVSISADGNTAIVGGYRDNNNIGAAWIYTRSGNTWTQQGNKLVGTGNIGNSYQGTSVCLSADGNTAIVGGYRDNAEQGAVWIYTRSGTTWSQQGNKLVGTGNVGAAYQGTSVSLSADGNTAIVGGYQDNSFIGATWVFTRSGANWSQKGNKLVGTGSTGTSSQGLSVSLSADGKTAIVGGNSDNTSIGAAWVFSIAPAPTVSSFTPTSATTGTTVTITGTDFTGATAVSFGGTPATSFSVVSATSITAVVAAGTTGTVSVTTPSGTGTSSATFTYILPPVQVFTSGTLQASYINLKAAFTAINAGTHTGNITVKLISSQTIDASSLPVLNASGTGGANYSAINIYPANSGIILSGSAPNPFIDLNGADNVTIDGRVNATGSVNDLVISNSSVSLTLGVSAIRFYNDASNNTVKYCTLKGSFQASNGGGVLFFGSGTTTGNNNNTIDHNNITNAADDKRMSVAINSIGLSLAVSNKNNTISNNNFYDFLKRTGTTTYGIKIESFNTAWTVSGNSFYETTPLVPAVGSITAYCMISVDNTSGNNFTISNNFIGGSAPACGGSPFTKTNIGNNKFSGIALSTGAGTASNIQGNTITNFSYANSGNGGWTGIGLGISASSVNVGTTTGNTIGAATGTGAISFTGGTGVTQVRGIYSGVTGVLDIQNNIIGSITTTNSSTNDAILFAGTDIGGNPTATFSNNTIGSLTTANSIQSNSAALVSTQTMTGLYTSVGTGSLVASGNTIANLTNRTSNATGSTLGYVNGIFANAGTITFRNNTVRDLTIANANFGYPPNASVAGISTSGSATTVVSGNTVYNLSNSNPTFAGYVTGIYFATGAAGSTVSGNFVRDLSVHASSNTARIDGLMVVGGPVTVSHNLINLGGNTTTTLYGITENNVYPSSSLYFNSVYIGGRPTTGSSNSYAFFTGGSNSRIFKNNVFYNARSNNGGNGNHYAIHVWSSSSLSLDYNNYYASGVGGKIGRLFATDITTLPIITGQNAHSLSIDPLFANAGGTLVSDYKPTAVMAGTTISIAGLNKDIAGTTRATTPTMGVYESSNLSSPTFGAFTIASKTYGDADFVLTAPTTNSTGAITYTSSNTAAATISGKNVTIIDAGITTITATQAATGTYAAGTVTAVLTVNKANQVLTLSPLPTGGVALNTFTTLAVSASSSAYGLQPVISLGAGSAATLNNNSGNYSLSAIGSTGTVTIKVDQAGNSNYNAASTLIQSFDVTKGNQTVTFGALSPLIYATGLTSTLAATTTATGLMVSFAIVSGPGTITGNTLTITGAGTIVILAYQEGDANWNEATSVNQELVVSPAVPIVTSFSPTLTKMDASVTIIGQYFTDVTAVSFGGMDATSFSVVSATEISATVGLGASGVVSVTSMGGTGGKSGFTVMGEPVVIAFDPVVRTTGTVVTITGNNFSYATSVSFGGTEAASFTVVNDGEISAVVGAGETGVVMVGNPVGVGYLGGFKFIPTWMGGSSTNWNTGSNWTHGNVPSSGTDVLFSASATRDLELTANFNAGTIDFNGSNKGIVLGNYDLNVNVLSGVSATSFVQTTGTGKLKMIIPNGVGVAFPIGKSVYNPVTITNNTGADDEFSVSVLDEVYANSISGTNLTTPRVKRTWDISKTTTNAGDGVNLDFNWDAADAVNLTAPALYHFEGGAWVAQLNATTFTTTSLSYTGYTGTFSPFAVGEFYSTLPLTWVDFTATAKSSRGKATEVLLNWKTANEFNAKDFVVQHKTNTSNWMDLGIVHALSNSTPQAQYDYTDKMPTIGNNYYRLLQRDIDGKSSYSKVVSVSISEAVGLQLFPNPVTQGVLNIQLPAASMVTLFNAGGQMVWKQQLNAGTHPINVSQFSKGMYLLFANGVSKKVVIE